MLTIGQSDIVMAQSANNKQQAIRAIAAGLVEKGYVGTGYDEGMLAREQQNSTFLGAGIAIPHGTTETRDLVNSTGVLLHHFPEGVDWGNGNTVYLAVGIAAKSDEHLTILKQLTKTLGADGIEQAIKQATSAEALAALLTPDNASQTHIHFDSTLIQQGCAASDMLQLTAIAAGRINLANHTDKTFVADVISKAPTYLGQGIWLVASDQGVHATALAFVSPAEAFDCDQQPVQGLLCIASNKSDLQRQCLENLITLINDKTLSQLTTQSPEALVALLTQVPTKGLTATFTVHNAHGLHARPGAMLVSVAKKFNSAIQIVNLDGDGTSANAKSLMKLMTLGVKHGHRLQFSADGDDAQQALDAIGEAIAQGLGESK
ncbi:fused PTS fructose transporter subunit IIA/HPr protein [Motilimonas sp. KMU-193]|uniref:fused PTS fructose transporter subunit IIA/HPr protein n=1 Tax=Motilimonas sp. KMU-193 TaxID=3388668 RepID=UPI00396B02F5